ncbi:hypothetical protein QYF61_019304, partial [Mycteria americana]
MIEHSFCGIVPILYLVCSEHLVFIATVVIDLIPFIFIAASYIQIIHTILQMPSAEGRCKAFFTCIAHLAVLTLFYCTTGLIHLKTKSSLLANSRKLVALSYTVGQQLLGTVIPGHKKRKGIGQKIHVPPMWRNTNPWEVHPTSLHLLEMGCGSEEEGRQSLPETHHEAKQALCQ